MSIIAGDDATKRLSRWVRIIGADNNVRQCWRIELFPARNRLWMTRMLPRPTSWRSMWSTPSPTGWPARGTQTTRSGSRWDSTIPIPATDPCVQTNLPVFRVKESSVRRRYSDFEWLRNELERDSKVYINHFLSDHMRRIKTDSDWWMLQIVVPPLPSKAMKRQLPFRSDDGIFEEDFIEDRRSGLEGFVNK